MEILGWVFCIIVAVIWVGIKLLDGMTRHANFWNMQNTSKIARDIEEIKNNQNNSSGNAGNNVK